MPGLGSKAAYAAEAISRITVGLAALTRASAVVPLRRRWLVAFTG